MKQEATSRGEARGRRETAPSRACGSLLLLAAGAMFIVLSPVGGDRVLAWSPEDSAFGRYLIRELGYLDTASRWLDSLERGRGSPSDRCEIASFRIDILLAEGKEEEAAAALEEFKRSCPDHPRASGGNLDLISRAMGTVVALFEKAKLTPDPEKAETSRKQAKQIFLEKVQQPLDTLIANLNSQVEKLDAEFRERQAEAKGGPPQRPQELDNRIFARDRAELSRLKAYLVYARQLDADEPERKAILEKGAELADKFVESRYDFYVMQYEGQLQRGLYAYELGKYSLADDHLGILYDILPPGQPPYPPPVVTAFKNLRLQAILFGARALLESNNTRRALGILESHFLRSDGGAFDLSNAEDDPGLRKYAVLAKLEYGVALAKAGRTVEGLDQIQELIRRYQGGTGQEEGYLNDARKALAELATLGVKLRGEDLYEAGMGLKGQLEWEPALGMFQRALAVVEPAGPADRRVQLRCLNEIGECSFILLRYAESAVAYKDAHDYFRETGEDAILDKVANNYLPAVNKTIEESGAGGPAWESLSAEAQAFYNERIGGVGLEQLKMVEAGRLEDEGQFAEAREKYLSVARETKDAVKVPFYWRARASAWMCLYKEWEAADEAGKKELEPELDQALEELAKIVHQALGDEMDPEGTRDTAGAATAALGIAQIHFAREPTDWQAIVDALEVFTTALAGETSYRCMGLGYLVLAGTRLGDCEESLKRFLALRKCEECKQDSVVGLAAQALSDCFHEAGDLKKSAVLILMWAQHPSAKEDLENPRVLLLVASRLIEGGMASRSVPYIKRLREKLAGDPELERQILILEAKRQAVEKSWDQVIETLEKYVADFEARGDHYEDPYVRKDLAEAYISRGKGKPTTKDALAAEKHYSSAIYIINERLKKDPKLDRTFWLWAKRWLEINKFLGDAGQTDAYAKIVAFVDRFQHKEMGGPKLKDAFLELGEYATSKLPKGPGSR